MYFLESIAGLTGEELTSATLKYLLVHSELLRKEFLSLDEIKRHFPSSRLPSFRHGLLCFTEFPTQSQTLNDGKIDILLQADNCLLSIENKFWADFQPNQPSKHRETLENKSKQLFGIPNAFKLICLFPAGRGGPNGDIEPELSNQGILGQCILLTWETVISRCVDPVINNDGPSNSVVASSLKEFVMSHIGMKVIEINKENLVGQSVIVGNEFQWELLYRLRDLFPNASRMRSAKSHAGFYFRMDENEPEKWNWFGFIRDNGNSSVVLMIESHLTNLDLNDLPHFVKGQQIPGKSRHIIDFPKEAKSIIDWKKLVEPCLDRIQTMDAMDVTLVGEPITSAG